MLNVNTIKYLENVSTPFYYYDMALLDETVSRVSELSSEYGIEVHYAVKANADERILRRISAAGIGADCVSGDEVLHALKCGFPPEKIVFAGVGKSDRELYDSLRAGISAFNCESLQEMFVLNAMAEAMGKKADICVRINPNIDAHTHKYVTTGLHENKFGIAAHEFEDMVSLVRKCASLNFTGLHFHVGSQITKVPEVFGLECRRVNEIVEFFESKGLVVNNIDLGGGLGVDYEEPDDNPVPDFESWFRTIDAALGRRPDQRVHVEPGRSIVAQCGSLMTRVLFVKNGETKNFVVADAGMNDLIRPALYGAYHKIENLSSVLRPNFSAEQAYDIVGPVCESSDVWGTGRFLPLSVRGDLLAIRSAGAYGQVMASNYNLRPFAPSVYSDMLDKAPVAVDYFEKCKE